MNEYVVGVVRDRTIGSVIMIQKARPAWQKGKLNFPGGKIEAGETPEEAVSREFQEEVGTTKPPDDWEVFAILEETDKFRVYCLRLKEGVKFELDRENTPATDEPICYTVPAFMRNKALIGEAIENAGWIMALAEDRSERKGIARIEYRDLI